jgi:hypothetical protein
MTTPYVDTHIKRLAIAREAAELGARKKAVAQLSCLPYRDVARLFSRERGKGPRGVPPSSEIWASEAPLLCRVEAAIFCNLFERLRMAGHGSSVSMVVAYREFAGNYQPMLQAQAHRTGQSEDTLTFDRAFQLVANLRLSCPSDRALWLRPIKVQACDVFCLGARSVQADTDLQQCPMCRLVHRLKSDPRVRHVKSSAERQRGAFSGCRADLRRSALFHCAPPRHPNFLLLPKHVVTPPASRRARSPGRRRRLVNLFVSAQTSCVGLGHTSTRRLVAAAWNFLFQDRGICWPAMLPLRVLKQRIRVAVGTAERPMSSGLRAIFAPFTGRLGVEACHPRRVVLPVRIHAWQSVRVVRSPPAQAPAAPKVHAGPRPSSPPIYPPFDAGLPVADVDELIGQAVEILRRLKLAYGVRQSRFDAELAPIVKVRAYVHLLPAAPANYFPIARRFASHVPGGRLLQCAGC